VGYRTSSARPVARRRRRKACASTREPCSSRSRPARMRNPARRRIRRACHNARRHCRRACASIPRPGSAPTSRARWAATAARRTSSVPCNARRRRFRRQRRNVATYRVAASACCRHPARPVRSVRNGRACGASAPSTQPGRVPASRPHLDRPGHPSQRPHRSAALPTTSRAAAPASSSRARREPCVRVFAASAPPTARECASAFP
jgi:hypothetical protein